jgi:DNA-binding NtrC family response regulator
MLKGRRLCRARRRIRRGGAGLLAREEFFMVITDARLGGMSGYEFLARIHNQWPDAGAHDHRLRHAQARGRGHQGRGDGLSAKPFAPEELLHAVGRCAERHRLLRENAALRSRAGETFSLEQIVGESPKMRELRQLDPAPSRPPTRACWCWAKAAPARNSSPARCTALSQRRDANYIRINCAAIPETLLESELFGHEKGAFTGALKQKPGRVEEADGGTIFLDEIADMSKPLQAKLLRFLEDGTFTRVGGTEELRVNVRLIAATNRDIVQAIAEGQFREDLFHRLNVVQFNLPPLRERGDDVLLLAEHFLKMFRAAMNKNVTASRARRAAETAAHRWPGNVRELRNVIERALILETTPRNPAVQPAGFSNRNAAAKSRAGPGGAGRIARRRAGTDWNAN